MSYACQECRLEKGFTSWLRQAPDGTWVCETDSSHKYKVDSKGFVHQA